VCCGAETHHGWHRSHHQANFRACGGPAHFGRCFPTRDETIAWLEQYLESLREEVKGVEEHIANMKNVKEE
jgi:hypothetical protein